MARGLIQNRLALANKADYTNAKDVQNYIQALVNYEALIEWARRPDEQPKQSIYGLPSRWMDKKEPWYKKLTMFIP